MIHFLLIALLALKLQRQNERLQPEISRQVWLDLRSKRWRVRRDAFEHLVAISEAERSPAVTDALIRLRETENEAAQRGDKRERDLYEDDDYVAYDDQMSKQVEAIAVGEDNPRAWRALVHERYNPDSEFGDWLASHKAALPYLSSLFQSPYVWYRGIACYIVADMLAKNKAAYSFSQSEYEQYKRRIRWHILHDTPGIVTGFAIRGLGLTDDPEDISFLEMVAANAKLPFDREQAAKTAEAIRTSIEKRP